MDRLVVLEKGQIVEEGTHAELLARGGHYAQLWERQSGGFLDMKAEQAAGVNRGGGPVVRPFCFGWCVARSLTTGCT